MNTLQIVALPGHLKTSYGPGGITRANGRPIPWGSLLAVERAGGAVWRATPGMAEALDRLDRDVRAEGAEGLPLTEVFRPWQVQADARTAYESWLAAGKPTPGGTGWRRGMKAAYVARPGYSNHGWGGAVDFDVERIVFEPRGGGRALAGNAALAHLWELAAAHGLSPVIAHPLVHASEAWHFDRLGPLAGVAAALRADNRRDVYGEVALHGQVLAGQWRGSLASERYVQARLNLGGFYCGPADGQLGRRTRAALEAAGVAWKVGAALDVVPELDRLGVGLAELAAL